MTVPEIVANAVNETCAEIGAEPKAIDVATIGATCNLPLNQQGLLSGLVAMVPGLGAKPIETVENACATGGQAVLECDRQDADGARRMSVSRSVFEKMRNDEGKMDGTLIGEVLGYFSHPGEREGKVYVFPHLFAEVMRDYMAAHGTTEREFAEISAREYANGNKNPYAQMQKVEVSVDEAATPEGRNRYIVDGLPLKTYDCSQITDGYAGMILATGEGLAKLGVAKSDCVEIAGWGQATDPLMKENREVLKPEGAFRAMNTAYKMAGASPDDVNVSEVHDCFTVMGAIGAEVIGKAGYGEGARYWTDGKADAKGECGINTSGGLIAKGHPIGASGVAMIGWCAWQLLGKVPAELQVPDPKLAATFNIGGPICASVCTVLKRA